LCSGSKELLIWPIPSQQFLDCIADQCPIGLQYAPLMWMCCEGIDQIANGNQGVFGSGDDQ
jgi:hypothetical protein